MSMIGKTLAHYEITSPLGRGGMGEVYQAKDRKLGRDVAIKVLPEEFAKDADRVARFQREAKLLASLNHTNIAAIYGLEASDQTNFLVLELVEGQTLADRIKAGSIPIEESLKLALQIAEALEAAHEKGVIHRDLKPANIKVTPDGKVKVLDFGLAKAFAGDQTELNLSNSPTLTRSPTLSDMATQQGVILGTAAYMSPEQARGRAVDKRADIWAFGCVLYEMLTGQAAFQGEDVTEILAAILKGEPDWKLLPQDVPAKVQEVLQRCLQKDLKVRYHDIADVRLDIEAPATQPLKTTAAFRRPSLLWSAGGAAVMLLAGILISPALMKYFSPAPPGPVVTATIKIEPSHWLYGYQSAMELQRPSRTAIAISSDARFVIYSAIQENPGPQAKSQLYLRRMDQAESRPVTGTEGGINPFLSPDNRWVGFIADQKLKKVPVEGGVATALCDVVSEIYGASWGRDNSIAFGPGYHSGLSIISADGGKPEILTKPDPKREEYSHRLPSWLPNGKAVLFTIMRHSVDSEPWLALLRLDTREWHVLLEDAADARYVPTGHLVFLRQGTLMAARFDPASLEITGKPFALVENVMQAFSTSVGFHTLAGQFGVSETGSLIYAEGGVRPDLKNSLVWVDQRGTEQPVAAAPQFPFFGPRLSPDGRRIAYVAAGRKWQIYIYDLSRGVNTQLVREGRPALPIWNADGTRLLFAWQKSRVPNLFWQLSDGSAPMERLTTSQNSQYPGSWSSDGKTLAFADVGEDANIDIALLDVSSGRVTPFLNSQYTERCPEFSPDGRWIAYDSNESGRAEVYVRPFSGPGKKFQVSSEGGQEPLWARNGKQLFYRWRDQVWVADVQTDGGFAPTKPRLLFEKPGYYSSILPTRTYDLSLDGQRFLMVKLDQSKPTPVTEMILVQNWFEELKQRVPGK